MSAYVCTDTVSTGTRRNVFTSPKGWILIGLVLVLLAIMIMNVTIDWSYDQYTNSCQGTLHVFLKNQEPMKFTSVVCGSDKLANFWFKFLYFLQERFGDAEGGKLFQDIWWWTQF